jgi:hypothetical protein
LKGGKAPLFFVWLDPWEIDSKEPRYCMWFSKKIPLVLFLGFVFFFFFCQWNVLTLDLCA